MIKLRDGEEVLVIANFHWSTYLFSGTWAVVGISLLVAEIVTSIRRNPVHPVVYVLTVGLFFLPLAYRRLQNWCKSYVLTNYRLYVETGILAKVKKDIPLHKMNDVEMSQGILQRIFNAGNILVLTGNDTPTSLKNIDNPDAFKGQLTESIRRTATSARSKHG